MTKKPERPGSALNRWIPDELLSDAAPAAQLCAGLLEICIDEVSSMALTWKQLSKIQQDHAIDKMRSRILQVANDAVDVIAAADFPRASVEIDSLKAKKGTQLVVNLKDGKHVALDHVGKAAVLVFADVEDFTAGIMDREGEDEQKSLDLEEPAEVGPAPMKTLGERLVAQGVNLPDDHEFWGSGISPEDLSRIHDFVEALEAGKSAKPPGLLGPFLPGNDDGEDAGDEPPPPPPDEPDDTLGDKPDRVG